jgi:hypothetical protein
MGIGAIFWACSFVWYGDKSAIKRNAYVMKTDECLIFKTVKQKWQFGSRNPQYHSYNYTLKNISHIHKSKYNIIVYGDIVDCNIKCPKIRK